MFVTPNNSVSQQMVPCTQNLDNSTNAADVDCCVRREAFSASTHSSSDSWRLLFAHPTLTQTPMGLPIHLGWVWLPFTIPGEIKFTC